MPKESSEAFVYPKVIVDSLKVYQKKWYRCSQITEQLAWMAEVNSFLKEFDPDGHTGRAEGPWIRFGRATGYWRKPSNKETDEDIRSRYFDGQQALHNIIKERPRPHDRIGQPMPPDSSQRETVECKDKQNYVINFVKYDIKWLIGTLIALISLIVAILSLRR